MAIGRGVPVPMPSRPQSLLTYTNLDGTTAKPPPNSCRRYSTPGSAARPSGSAITRSPRRLASLGLPKKAFACMSIANVDMTFGDAGEIG